MSEAEREALIDELAKAMADAAYAVLRRHGLVPRRRRRPTPTA